MGTHKLVQIVLEGEIAHLRLSRPRKRNAINNALLAEIEGFFSAVPEGVRSIVLSGEGEHFCAGLDLAEHQARTPFEVAKHSQSWHRVFNRIQVTGIPVVSALQGAVIGGGMELAMSTHLRVAEPSAFFQLPEGRHGIFVGGGASVRVARIIGAGRMADMMLTGRICEAEEALRLGLVHYLVGAGEGLAKAFELARRVAENAPLSNWAMVTALLRIDNMSADDGFYTESLVAGLTQSSEEVQRRIGDFLTRKK